jgi:uncharacterized RDD family membrane protein YckC
MKNVPDADLPDLLRKRILRQRKRLKIVRFSFAITAVVSVLLLFAANQTQTLAPTARVIGIIRPEPLWMIDQHLDIASESELAAGTFAILRVDGETITQGTRYDGLVRSVTMLDENRLGITTPSRFMVFDISGEEWTRAELRSLGLNDPTASPVVVNFQKALWLCWVRGADIMVQPFGREDVEPKSVHKTGSAGAEVQAVVSGGSIWLSILETRSGDLTLLSFKPRIESAVGSQPVDADRDADEVEANPPTFTTAVQIEFNREVTGNVRLCSFTVIETPQGPRPVVGIVRKEEGNRAWQMMAWTRDSQSTKGSWADADPPPRAKPITGLELSNFLALATQGQAVRAVFSEVGEVRTAEGTLDAKGALNWSEPSVVPLDKTTGPAIYIIWITVLFAVVLIMASQGVWLLLNRERPMDRTLAEILDNQEKEGGPAKDLPKLLYANPFARAISLLLDIAITSPVVILLQGVYDYSWEQAYGFLAIGTVTSFDADLLPVIKATAVTLLVLAIYGMACELLWGRTFGKALFKLRVVDAEGEAPAPWRIVVRNFLKIFELIHWAVLLIPMGLMMMSGKQQRLGDLAAGTFVIVDVIPDEAPDDIDI